MFTHGRHLQLNVLFAIVSLVFIRIMPTDFLAISCVQRDVSIANNYVYECTYMSRKESPFYIIRQWEN